ncbi:MAG TPA: hypothetical protein VF762_24005, partial [Blastocatellia bacterium]
RKLVCTLLIMLACSGFALAQGAQKQSSEASRSFTIETGPRTVARVEIARSTTLSDPLITVKTGESPRAFGKGFVISSLIYGGGAIYDTKTTQIAVDHYGLQEKDPLYRGEGGSFLRGRNVAVTAGIYATLLPFQK